MYPYRQKAYHRLELPFGPKHTSRLGGFTGSTPHIFTSIYDPVFFYYWPLVPGEGSKTYLIPLRVRRR